MSKLNDLFDDNNQKSCSKDLRADFINNFNFSKLFCHFILILNLDTH